MKKAFSLLELIIVISLMLTLYTFFIPKTKINKLEEVTNRLELYLNQVRYKAFINDKYSTESKFWFKKRWTMKFFRCRKSVGGIYYLLQK